MSIFLLQNTAYAAVEFIPVYSCKSIARIFTPKKNKKGQYTMFVKSTERAEKNIGNLSFLPHEDPKKYNSSINFYHEVEGEKIEFTLNAIYTWASEKPEERASEIQYLLNSTKFMSTSTVDFYEKKYPENFGLSVNDSVKLKKEGKTVGFEIRCKKTHSARVSL